MSAAFRITRPGLRRQVPDQLLLGRRQGLSRPLLDRQRAEQLAPMPDGLEHRCTRHDALLDRRHRPRGRGLASSGHVASGRSSSPTRTQTSARAAPVPSPSARAILGSSSSFAYVCPTRSENSDSTSYGVARLP